MDNENAKLLKQQLLIQKITLGLNALMMLMILSAGVYISSFVSDAIIFISNADSLITDANEKLNAIDIDKLNEALDRADTLIEGVNQAVDKTDGLIDGVDSAVKKTNNMITDIDTAMGKTNHILDDLQEVTDAVSGVTEAVDGVKKKVDSAKNSVTGLFKR